MLEVGWWEDEEVIEESQLKFKGVKAETVHGEEGLEGVTTSAPSPLKKSSYTTCMYCLFKWNFYVREYEKFGS